MPSDQCGHCPGSHTGQRSCLASATTKAQAWLLIEHPGPWAARLEQTGMEPAVRRALERAREHSVRVQLIRRSGRRRSVPPVQVYAGWSGPEPWLEGKELADPGELNELDLRAVGAGLRPGFGTPAPRLLLVCANGKRNVCCARFGVPLARKLHEAFGEAVWETTHVGGDRYSANMVCLPHGLYYGDLAITDGLTAAARYLRGEVWLERYRGHAGMTRPAQAAEHFLRDKTGVSSVGSVRILSVSDAVLGSGLPTEVVAEHGGDRYLVRVEEVPLCPCGPDCQEDETTFVLKDLVSLD